MSKIEQIEQGERNKSRVDFYDVLPDILARVGQAGEITEMEAWRKAYPEIEFMSEDDWGGVKIDWEERTILERAVYVTLVGSEKRDSMRMAVGLEYEEGEDRLPGLETFLYEGTYGGGDNDEGFYEWIEGDGLWWHWVVGTFRGFDLEGNFEPSLVSLTAKMGLLLDYFGSIPMSYELSRRLEGWFDYLGIQMDVERLKFPTMKLEVEVNR